jgi:hypothetical protein
MACDGVVSLLNWRIEAANQRHESLGHECQLRDTCRMMETKPKIYLPAKLI